MTSHLGTIIAAGGELGVGYAEKLLKGISAAQFARYATPGQQIIESNHPAFIIGHLGLYGFRIAEELGGPPAADLIPESYAGLFSKTATCQDDPEGSIYPAASEITEAFFSGYRAALEALRVADDETFARENPAAGPIKERFPTLGGMHAFLMGGHIMMHLGQLSAYRRMIGLGSA